MTAPFSLGDVDDAGDHDFLLGRLVDVWGTAFGVPTGWPCLLIELNLSVQQWDNAGAYAAGLPGRERIGDNLAARDMHPVEVFDIAAAPPEADRIRWTVQRHDRPGRASGVYAPGAGGRPRSWAVISPLPPWPAAIDALAANSGGQAAVYLTHHTMGLSYAGAAELLGGLAAEAAAGRLWTARAAIV